MRHKADKVLDSAGVLLVKTVNYKQREYRRLLRKEAEQRAIVRKARTNKQQIAKLDAGGFIAKKERIRLAS